MDDPPNLRLGRYAVTKWGDEAVRAFIPPPIPPNPPLRMERLQKSLEQANQAIGRLDGLASALPNLSLLIYAYVGKEAVLSSRIEGTQSSLSDLMLFENDEAPGVALHDVQEVSNYAAALSHGMERMRGGFPLSLRLIRELHEILLSKGRSQEKMPGEFRTSQNCIGGYQAGQRRLRTATAGTGDGMHGATGVVPARRPGGHASPD
jgi:Fic family protein